MAANFIYDFIDVILQMSYITIIHLMAGSSSCVLIFKNSSEVVHYSRVMPTEADNQLT